MNVEKGAIAIYRKGELVNSTNIMSIFGQMTMEIFKIEWSKLDKSCEGFDGIHWEINFGIGSKYSHKSIVDMCPSPSSVPASLLMRKTWINVLKLSKINGNVFSRVPCITLARFVWWKAWYSMQWVCLWKGGGKNVLITCSWCSWHSQGIWISCSHVLPWW